MIAIAVSVRGINLSIAATGQIIGLLGPNGAGKTTFVEILEGLVRNYLSESMAKLGVTNRIEAARLARQRGCCNED